MRPLEFRIYNGPVDVRWFGAKGNGREDDSLAFQNAIEHTGTTGGTIECQKRTFGIATTIDLGDAATSAQGIVIRGGSRSKAYTGGTMLKWIGASGAGPILRIRNAATGSLENLSFDGNALASYGLQIAHVQGDTDVVRSWEIRGCHFSEARTHNVLVGEAGTVATGDNCCLSFYNCNFGASFSAAPTESHVRLLAGETFSTAFYNCQFTGHPSGGYPTRGIAIQAGTCDVHSALFETLSEADLYLDCRAGKPIPALNVFGAHSQSAQFLKTNTGGAATVADAALTGTVLIGVVHSDIIAPTSANSVFWDVRSHSALTMVGCRLQGNVEIGYSAANVFSSGVYFDDVSGNFTGVGARQVCGTWIKNGIYNQRQPGLANHASNAAAVAGGLSVGDLYRTAGTVMVVV